MNVSKIIIRIKVYYLSTLLGQVDDPREFKISKNDFYNN